MITPMPDGRAKRLVVDQPCVQSVGPPGKQISRQYQERRGRQQRHKDADNAQTERDGAKNRPNMTPRNLMGRLGHNV